MQEVKGYAQDLHYYALHLHRGYSHKIAEEIADAEIMIEQLKQIFDIAPLVALENKGTGDWEKTMNPEENTKWLYNNANTIGTAKQIDMDKYLNKVIPIMQARWEVIQPLTELLNLIEHHAVYLYFLEMASNDEFTIKYTERLF